MATTQIDDNRESVAKAVNDDSTGDPTPLLVDPTTNRLLIDVDGNPIGIVWNELVGTGDGATTDFVLAYDPQDTDAILICNVAGGNMFLTDDFTLTLASKTVSFLTAPPLGAKVYITYQKS